MSSNCESKIANALVYHEPCFIKRGKSLLTTNYTFRLNSNSFTIRHSCSVFIGRSYFTWLWPVLSTSRSLIWHLRHLLTSTSAESGFAAVSSPVLASKMGRKKGFDPLPDLRLTFHFFKENIKTIIHCSFGRPAHLSWNLLRKDGAGMAPSGQEGDERSVTSVSIRLGRNE